MKSVKLYRQIHALSSPNTTSYLLTSLPPPLSPLHTVKTLLYQSNYTGKYMPRRRHSDLSCQVITIPLSISLSIYVTTPSLYISSLPPTLYVSIYHEYQPSRIHLDSFIQSSIPTPTPTDTHTPTDTDTDTLAFTALPFNSSKYTSHILIPNSIP